MAGIDLGAAIHREMIAAAEAHRNVKHIKLTYLIPRGTCIGANAWGHGNDVIIFVHALDWKAFVEEEYGMPQGEVRRYRGFMVLQPGITK